jgi:AraC-like DNA-binding protein
MEAQRFEYTEYPPCPELEPYVECFWSSVSTEIQPGLADKPQIVLPDGCIDILFDFGEHGHVIDPGGTRTGAQRNPSASMIVGTMTRPLTVPVTNREHLVAVRFKPGKAHAILRLSAGEITDHLVSLADLWGSAARSVESELHDTGEPARQAACLERKLIQALGSNDRSDKSLDPIVSFVIGHSGTVSVEALASHAGLTRQQLARKFDRYVGLSPKTFCRVIRFKNLLTRARRSREIDWTALALDLGYFDQSHMISDFKEFSGLAPQRFLSAD